MVHSFILPPIYEDITHWNYIANIIKEKHIEILPWAQRDTAFPQRAKPDIDYQHTDIDYRIHHVLPYPEDKNASAYIVYPKLGVIIPVLIITDNDQVLLRSKQWFDHYKYLRWGSLHYLGNSPSQWNGNMVIAAHSSYYHKDSGRYKTAFQVVALSSVGDHIRYFEKNRQGSFDRYDYSIDVIGQVSSKDNSIIRSHGKNSKELTTYTCYPFGSTANRMFNRAHFIWKNNNHF